MLRSALVQPRNGWGNAAPSVLLCGPAGGWAGPRPGWGGKDGVGGGAGKIVLGQLGICEGFQKERENLWFAS